MYRNKVVRNPLAKHSLPLLNVRCQTVQCQAFSSGVKYTLRQQPQPQGNQGKLRSPSKSDSRPTSEEEEKVDFEWNQVGLSWRDMREEIKKYARHLDYGMENSSNISKAVETSRGPPEEDSENLSELERNLHRIASEHDGKWSDWKANLKANQDQQEEKREYEV